MRETKKTSARGRGKATKPRATQSAIAANAAAPARKRAAPVAPEPAALAPTQAEPAARPRATLQEGAQAAAPSPKPEHPRKAGGPAETIVAAAQQLDPSALAGNAARIAERSHKLVSDFLRRQREAGKIEFSDPLNLGNTMMAFTKALAQDPMKLVELNVGLWKDYANLWAKSWQRLLGQDVEPVIRPLPNDKRFRDKAWDDNQIFDFIKQSYLLTANFLHGVSASAEGLDPKTRRKVDFYTKQFVDALAPTNFALTNPEVVRTTLASNGENLVKGLDNLLRDLERGQGSLAIAQTDMAAFEIGRNIATAPGKVIFRSELMELLQYEPTTEKVRKRPLLIFPPWINKFYILDLRPENSFIRWAVAQGYTVFVASWVNPDARLAQKSFEDYMQDGILAALGAVEQATGERQVNAIGYCIGGTLLGATLAYMAAKKDDRIAGATFFAAQVDFSEPGDLEVFIDEEQLQSLEQQMVEAGGFLEGRKMATTFNMLRSNDLIWSFVVNNYLLGKNPAPFDLLYWNADATRMPIAMHMFYLRECYMKNALAKGEMVLGGERLDLGKVTIPVCLQSAREDHIAPFRSVYKATRLFGGETTFFVAGSGHIAGVINHPEAGKYQYWLGPDESRSVEDWWQDAEEHPGSWWPWWEEEWLRPNSGPLVPARIPGDGALKPLADAPGTYVLAKS